MSKILHAQPGAIVNKIAIRVVFDPYFETVLVPSFLKPLPRLNRKAVPQYEVMHVVPDASTYQSLRTQRFTTSASSLIEAIQSEIEALGEEMRSWYENLPDGLNSSDKAGEIDEAASALEDITVPDYPEAVENIMLCHLPSLEQASRPKRAAEVGAKLDSVITAVQGEIEAIESKLADLQSDNEDERSEGETEEEIPDVFELEEAKSGLENFLTELEEVKSQLEDVTFPSMM